MPARPWKGAAVQPPPLRSSRGPLQGTTLVNYIGLTYLVEAGHTTWRGNIHDTIQRMRHLAGVSCPVVMVLPNGSLVGSAGDALSITDLLARLGCQLSLTAHNRTLGSLGEQLSAHPKNGRPTRGFENRPSGGRSHMERMGPGLQTRSAEDATQKGWSPPGTSRVAIRRLSMYLCAGLKRLTICHIIHKWQVMLQANSDLTATSEWTMVRRRRLGSKRASFC